MDKGMLLQGLLAGEPHEAVIAAKILDMEVAALYVPFKVVRRAKGFLATKIGAFK